MDMKQEAVYLYQKKIVWAAQQPPDDPADEQKMEDGINLGWHSLDCPYCMETTSSPYCGNCVLNSSIDTTKAPEYCCDGLWDEMDASETWAEWITAAKKVQLYIEENG